MLKFSRGTCFVLIFQHNDSRKSIGLTVLNIRAYFLSKTGNAMCSDPNPPYQQFPSGLVTLGNPGAWVYITTRNPWIQNFFSIPGTLHCQLPNLNSQTSTPKPLSLKDANIGRHSETCYRASEDSPFPSGEALVPAENYQCCIVEYVSISLIFAGVITAKT